MEKGKVRCVDPLQFYPTVDQNFVTGENTVKEVPTVSVIDPNMMSTKHFVWVGRTPDKKSILPLPTKNPLLDVEINFSECGVTISHGEPKA